MNLNGHLHPTGPLDAVAETVRRFRDGSCARAENPAVAWAKVSRVTVARRRLRVSVLAELPNNSFKFIFISIAAFAER